jgi:hypothetical protein
MQAQARRRVPVELSAHLTCDGWIAALDDASETDIVLQIN